jgi:hypothetical protein
LRILSRVCDFRERPIARLRWAVAVPALLLASCASFQHLTQVGSTFPTARECGQRQMEAVTRKVTQPTGGISNVLVAMEKQVRQRRHTSRILAEAPSRRLIGLTIAPSSGSLEVRVENSLPHDLPTGDFGFRIVTLGVFGIDAGGKSSLTGSWELAGESATAIPAQGTRTWSLDIGHRFQTARAVLTRRSYDQEALVLAEAQVEVAKP